MTKNRRSQKAMATSQKEASLAPTTFTDSYDKKVRPLIDLIDKLRFHGLDQDVQLPAIAVIGDQSAGKSSALEAISGVQLPRGAGIVTRCALEIRLKHSNDNDVWLGNIRYNNKLGKLCIHKINKGSQVGDFIRRAQDEMTDGDKGISQGLIRLEITSSTVPDLTLIDLPGIARVPVAGQPPDICHQIKRLIKEYIQKQETIILAVIPCNVDIATTEALSMAKEMDQTNERTLGVLTKPDLVDKGAEGEISKILRNDAYRLEKGYIVVKCRGQLDVDNNKSLTDSIKDEENFFRNHDKFSEVPAHQRGIKSLSHKLTDLLVLQIKRTVPKLKKEVNLKLEKTNAKLKKMGKVPPSDEAGKIGASLEMVQKFVDDLKNVCDGEYSKLHIKESNEEMGKYLDEDIIKIRTFAGEQFADYGKRVKKFLPVYDYKIETEDTGDPNSLRFLPGKRVSDAGNYRFTNSSNAAASPLARELMRLKGVTLIIFEANCLLVQKAENGITWDTLKPDILAIIMDFFASGLPLLTKDQDPCEAESDDWCLRRKIKEKLAKERGRELKNFLPYSIFEGFARDLILKAQRPAKAMMKNIVEKQSEILDILSEHHFASYVDYHREMKGEIHRHMKMFHNQLEENINDIFETEKNIYSQDKPYMLTLSDVTKSRLDKEAKATGDETQRKSYHSAQFDDNYKSPEETGPDMLLDSLRSYFMVASRRVSDFIPMIVIHILFIKFVSSLKDKLLNKCVDRDVISLVQEDNDRKNEREELAKKVERLEIADQELSKF